MVLLRRRSAGRRLATHTTGLAPLRGSNLPGACPLARVESRPEVPAVEAVESAGDLPIVLTRAGRERRQVAATVKAFTEAAGRCGAKLEIIDVPGGQHGFDMLDHTAESRQAVRRALNSVLALCN